MIESKQAEMASEAEIDAKCILPFVVRSRRTRWKELLATPKGRKKLLVKLWNGDDLDRSLMVQLTWAEMSVSVLLAKLKNLGAPNDCRLISARPALDRKTIDLPTALETVLNLAPATIVSCIPGKLAYYENEEKNGNYIIRA